MGLDALSPTQPQGSQWRMHSVDIILCQYAFVSTAQDLYICHYLPINTNAFIIICMCLQEYFAGIKLISIKK